MGTGKTLSVLWAADYLKEQKKVNRVLIVGPLSTLTETWERSIFCNFPHRTSIILHGTAKYRKEMLKQKADFYIINHDGLHVILNDLIDRPDINLIVYDEAAALRNISTNRFKILKYLKREKALQWLWLLTGTPTPNEPTDAWTLAHLVESKTLHKSYTGFKDQVMLKLGPYKWVPRSEAPQIVYNVLQPAIRYAREDCIDLPETTYQTYFAPFTKEQNKLYKEMQRHLYAEAAAGGITAVNEGVKLMKLVQICCGVVYGDDNNHIEIDCAPRIDLLKELIEAAAAKVIIFVPLLGAMAKLARELKTFSFAMVNGSVPKDERNAIWNRFQKDKSLRGLIAHPKVTAHGLTLHAADTIIWYGPIVSNETYEQANARIVRIGQTKSTHIIHIESSATEKQIYSKLRNKQRVQGIILDLVKGSVK